MTELLAVTEFFDEVDNIPNFVQNIAWQSVKPDAWLLIDDGSMDASGEIFRQACRVHKIPYYLESMPAKFEPDANKKGIAFQQSVLSDVSWLNACDFDYIIKIDADTLLPPDYIKQALRLMEADSTIGCFAGQIATNGVIRKMPCGTGKLVKIEVVKLTSGRYWDLDPDTLWNIKAHLNKYKLVLGTAAFSMTTVRPTALYNPQGRYKMGQRMAYVRCNTLLVIYRYLKSLKNRTHSWQFLKGYLREWLRLRDRWRCKDPDVQYFYSLKHRWDMRHGKIQRL